MSFHVCVVCSSTRRINRERNSTTARSLRKERNDSVLSGLVDWLPPERSFAHEEYKSLWERTSFTRRVNACAAVSRCSHVLAFFAVPKIRDAFVVLVGYNYWRGARRSSLDVCSEPVSFFQPCALSHIWHSVSSPLVSQNHTFCQSINQLYL